MVVTHSRYLMREVSITDLQYLIELMWGTSWTLKRSLMMGTAGIQVPGSSGLFSRPAADGSIANFVTYLHC